MVVNKLGTWDFTFSYHAAGSVPARLYNIQIQLQYKYTNSSLALSLDLYSQGKFCIFPGLVLQSTNQRHNQFRKINKCHLQNNYNDSLEGGATDLENIRFI